MQNIGHLRGCYGVRDLLYKSSKLYASRMYSVNCTRATPEVGMKVFWFQNSPGLSGKIYLDFNGWSVFCIGTQIFNIHNSILIRIGTYSFFEFTISWKRWFYLLKFLCYFSVCYHTVWSIPKYLRESLLNVKQSWNSNFISLITNQVSFWNQDTLLPISGNVHFETPFLKK